MMSDAPQLPLDLSGGQELLAPESLIPRLGETLIQEDLIDAAGLRRALDYQQNLVRKGRRALIGQVMVELGLISQKDLDRAVTHQIASLQNALIATNRQLEARAGERTRELNSSMLQIRTAAEITELAISARDLNELLHRTVSLLTERFRIYHAAIFRYDPESNELILKQASSLAGNEMAKSGFRLPATSDSILGWVVDQKAPRVSPDVRTDPIYRSIDFLPDTRSEAGIPIATGERFFGVLDVQSEQLDGFSNEMVTTLGIIANHIAAVAHNYELLSSTSAALQTTEWLYEASRQMSHETSPSGIYQILARLLQATDYITALLISDRKGFHALHFRTPGLKTAPQATIPAWINLPSTELRLAFPTPPPWRVQSSLTGFETPAQITDLCTRLGCRDAILLPIRGMHGIAALMLIDSNREEGISDDELKPFLSLTDLCATALDKLTAFERLERRLNALNTLGSVSQAIAVETDLNSLYEVIHAQIDRVMGNVSFLIALYDAQEETIHVPYASEGGEIISLPSIPLGEGLTSILIRTKEPLLLVEDTERKAAELGAKVVGEPARSWLGVPLIVAGEVIGAIIVQDHQMEYRFDDEDLRLMVTLASQVAIALRNARLLQEAHSRAERDHILGTISTEMWSSNDIDAILRTAITQLGRTLGASEGTIVLEAPQENGHQSIAGPGEARSES